MNLLPGMGLGFTGAKEIAFGLGAIVSSEIVIPVIPVIPAADGQVMYGSSYAFRVDDNAYSRRNDDNEILEILSITIPLIMD
jgi:hypothetical protein